MTFTTNHVALPNATAEEKEIAADLNAQRDSTYIAYVISDSLFKMFWDYNSSYAYHLTVNRRDSIIFNFLEDDDYVSVSSYAEYLERQKKDTLYQFTNIQHFPDS